MTALPSALAAARTADTARRRDRVLHAVAVMTAAGQDISVSSVARAARVHRSFIHRHPDLHAAVQEAQRTPAGPSPAGVSVSSLYTDLSNLHAQNARLARHIKTLESRLSDALGVQAYRASGIGGTDKTAQLEHRCVELEQRLLDLSAQLEERDDELHAARTANRDLMTLLNRPRGGTTV